MDKNRVFKAKSLHYWLNFTERLAEIILHRSPDSYDVTLEKCVPYGQGKYNNLDIIRPKNSEDENSTPVNSSTRSETLNTRFAPR